MYHQSEPLEVLTAPSLEQLRCFSSSTNYSVLLFWQRPPQGPVPAAQLGLTLFSYRQLVYFCAALRFVHCREAALGKVKSWSLTPSSTSGLLRQTSQTPPRHGSLENDQTLESVKQEVVLLFHQTKRPSYPYYLKEYALFSSSINRV